MKIRYTLHSVGNDQVDADVEFQGATITAKVPRVTLELVSEDPLQGNPVLRLSPDDPLASLDIGASIIGTFEPGKESPA